MWQTYTTVSGDVWLRIRSFDGVWGVWVNTTSKQPVISGTIGNRDYVERYPDGRMVCRGTYTFPSSANNVQTFNWTFGTAFVGELPFVTFSVSTSAPKNVQAPTFTNLTSSGVTVYFIRTTAAATNVHLKAEGRWL